METTRRWGWQAMALGLVVALVVTTGCLTPARQSHIDEMITRSYRTVFDRGPNAGARSDWTGRLVGQPYHRQGEPEMALSPA